MSNLITLSSVNVPSAAAVVSLFSPPLLVPCGVPALFLWVSPLSVNSFPLLLDRLRLTITMVGREHMEKMLANLVWWEWDIVPASICCFCKENHSCRSCYECWSWSVDLLPCTGLISGSGCTDGCSLPPPCDSHSTGQEGKRGAGDLSNQKGN